MNIDCVNCGKTVWLYAHDLVHRPSLKKHNVCCEKCASVQIKLKGLTGKIESLKIGFQTIKKTVTSKDSLTKENIEFIKNTCRNLEEI